MDIINNPSENINNSIEQLEEKVNKDVDAKYMHRQRTVVREYQKIGRNDLCPCGSGKKYKNCCLSSGKYENKHELTALEMANVKLSNTNLANITKKA